MSLLRFLPVALLLSAAFPASGRSETPKPPAQPEDAPPPRSDRHGDPLPPGVIARLGTLRFRGVRGCLAFSPDGKRLATATGPAGERVTIWDTATGRQVRQTTIDGGGTLRRLVFSPDGRRLLLTDNSRNCRIVNVETDEKLLELAGTEGAFSTNGKTIVTCLSGETSLVRSWDALTGKALLTQKFAINIHEFAVAGDGRMLAVTSKELGSEVKVLDLAKGTVVRSFRLAWSGQPRLNLTADGKTLASADFNAVRLWDMADGKMLDVWNCRNLSGSAVFSPDGKQLAWTSLDEKGGNHRLWVVACPGGKPRPVGAPVHNFETPCFSPDGKRLAIVTDASVLSLRNVADGKEASSFDAPNRPVTDLAFDVDGRHVFSRGGDEVFAWQTRTGKLLHREALLPVGHEYLAPLLPGGYLLTGERTKDPTQGRFWLRDMRTGEEVMRFDGRPDVGPPAAVAAPGGRYVAVRGRDSEMCVLDVRARRCLYRVPDVASGVKLSADGDVLVWYSLKAKSVEVHIHRQASGKTFVLRDMPKNERWSSIFDDRPCVSPDGRWLVLSMEGRLRRWDLITGKEVPPLPEALQTTWRLIWSPDSRFVAAQGSPSPPYVIDREAGRHVRVWDVRTGTRLAHLTVPNGHFGMHIHFTRDNRTMLITDQQGVIHLWEVATGKERMRLKGHLSYEIASLTVSADGHLLVSGGYDSQALVWDLTGRTPDGQWRIVRYPPEKLRAAWKALASENAKAAYAAMWQLIADPEGTTALLRERLRPVARPEAGQVARLIAALDSEKFAERERATRELETLEETVAAELRQTLTRKPSLEVRRRVEALLERLDHPPTGAQLQTLRAIETLEHIGTPGARQILKTLTEGAPEGQTTREAKTALARLERRSREQP
jgi:WD40 repeat protein